MLFQATYFHLVKKIIIKIKTAPPLKGTTNGIFIQDMDNNKKKKIRMHQGGKASFRLLIMYEVGRYLTLRRIPNCYRKKTRVAHNLVVKPVIIPLTLQDCLF